MKDEELSSMEASTERLSGEAPGVGIRRLHSVEDTEPRRDVGTTANPEPTNPLPIDWLTSKNREMSGASKDALVSALKNQLRLREGSREPSEDKLSKTRKLITTSALKVGGLLDINAQLTDYEKARSKFVAEDGNASRRAYEELEIAKAALEQLKLVDRVAVEAAISSRIADACELAAVLSKEETNELRDRASQYGDDIAPAMSTIASLFTQKYIGGQMALDCQNAVRLLITEDREFVAKPHLKSVE